MSCPQVCGFTGFVDESNLAVRTDVKRPSCSVLARGWNHPEGMDDFFAGIAQNRKVGAFFLWIGVLIFGAQQQNDGSTACWLEVKGEHQAIGHAGGGTNGCQELHTSAVWIGSEMVLQKETEGASSA